ncbi:hypothetical protein C8R43DRAFT_1207489 [Mycena crocata]|nr:hypothetical protein C8R43DRAFT_1207489 [Mycena crocata]
MPNQPLFTETRLNNIATALDATVNTLEILSDTFDTPFLAPISITTRSLLTSIETVRQNSGDCIQLLEDTYQLLNAIIRLHVESDACGELPPSTLKHVGKFTETLHQVHTFIEAQRDKSRIRQFFRQGEMNRLLKECKAGLQQALDVFKVQSVELFKNLTEIQKFQIQTKQSLSSKFFWARITAPIIDCHHARGRKTGQSAMVTTFLATFTTPDTGRCS